MVTTRSAFTALLLLCIVGAASAQQYTCGSPEDTPWAVRMHGLGAANGFPEECVVYEGELLSFLCEGYDDLEECSAALLVVDRGEHGIRVVNEETGAEHEVSAPPHCAEARARRQIAVPLHARSTCPEGNQHGSAWKTFAEFQACPDRIVGFNVSWTCPADPPHDFSPSIMPMLWWSGLEPVDHGSVLQPQTFWGFLDCDNNGGNFWAVGSAFVPTSGLLYISLAYPTTAGNSATGQIYSTSDGQGGETWYVVTIDNVTNKTSTLRLTADTAAGQLVYQEAFVVMEAYNGFSDGACSAFYPEGQTSITFTDFSLELEEAGVLSTSLFVPGTASGAVCGEYTTVAGNTTATMSATTFFPH